MALHHGLVQVQWVGILELVVDSAPAFVAQKALFAIKQHIHWLKRFMDRFEKKQHGAVPHRGALSQCCGVLRDKGRHYSARRDTL